MTEPNSDGRHRLFGRRQGRTLSPARQKALKELLPVLGIPAQRLRDGKGHAPESFFPGGVCSPGTGQKTIFEIGFGNGEHLAGLIGQNPQNLYLGAEPFINGMSCFLKTVATQKLPRDNIRVWMDDALVLARALTDESVDEIYVLNPDPWPKKRHFKRRIINQANLSQFARLLKSGGKLIMTTDVDDLAEWMVTQATLHPAFSWTATARCDWTAPPPGWIATRYEQKGAAAGRRQTYLIFECVK